MAGFERRAHHADDAGGGPRQDAVPAPERSRLDQSSVALHEQQPGVSQCPCHPVHVTPKHRREVSVGDGRIATRHQLRQGAYPVRDGHLGETRFGGDTGGGEFMIVVPVAVHQDHGYSADAGFAGIPQVPRQPLFVQRLQDGAVAIDSLVGLDHVGIERLRQDDMPVEQARTLLVADPQGVAESPCDHQRGRLAPSLQQGVGRHGGTHLDRLDRGIVTRRKAGLGEHRVDAGERGVFVPARVFGQQLQRRQGAVGPARDDVGERAPPIDPELPAMPGQIPGLRKSDRVHSTPRRSGGRPGRRSVR